MTGRDRVDGEPGVEGLDGGRRPLERFSVHEAALYLGLSVDAVRKRADRGTLRKEKDSDGTVYILLNLEDHPTSRRGRNHRSSHPTGGEAGSDDRTESGRNELATSLWEQVSYLRGELEVRNEELRRKDHLLAAALERVPRIEAPAAAPGEGTPGREEEDEKAARAGHPGDDGVEEPAERRTTWLGRLFLRPSGGR